MLNINIYAFLFIIFFDLGIFCHPAKPGGVYKCVMLNLPRLFYSVFVNADRFAVSEHVQDVLRVLQLLHRENNLILDEVSLLLQILHSILQEHTVMLILSPQHVFLSFEDVS